MPETLQPQDFEVLDRVSIPGTKVLEEFGFDAAKCSIVADDAGILLVTQEDVSDFYCAPDLWRRTRAA